MAMGKKNGPPKLGGPVGYEEALDALAGRPACCGGGGDHRARDGRHGGLAGVQGGLIYTGAVRGCQGRAAGRQWGALAACHISAADLGPAWSRG